MDILDSMGVSKLSEKVFFSKVNYSFNQQKATWFENEVFCFDTISNFDT